MDNPQASNSRVTASTSTSTADEMAHPKRSTRRVYTAERSLKRGTTSATNSPPKRTKKGHLHGHEFQIGDTKYKLVKKIQPAMVTVAVQTEPDGYYSENKPVIDKQDKSVEVHMPSAIDGLDFDIDLDLTLKTTGRQTIISSGAARSAAMHKKYKCRLTSSSFNIVEVPL